MAYLLFYRRKDLPDFSTAADEAESVTTSTADVATTAEAENNTNVSSDSEQDSDNAAEEGSDSNDDRLLDDIEAPRADFASLQAGDRSDDDD
jgi:hypothetical protein